MQGVWYFWLGIYDIIWQSSGQAGKQENSSFRNASKGFIFYFLVKMNDSWSLNPKQLVSNWLFVLSDKKQCHLKVVSFLFYQVLTVKFTKQVFVLGLQISSERGNKNISCYCTLRRTEIWIQRFESLKHCNEYNYGYIILCKKMLLRICTVSI